MKKIISVLFFLMLINSVTFAESYQHNSSIFPAPHSTTQAIQPRYIVSPVLASFESFIIRPQQVKTRQTINFELKLVGRDNLEVELFYVLPGKELLFLTQLINEGQGLYTGTYQVPEVPAGSYTDFRAIASNDEGEIELFTVTLPGVQVIPDPILLTRLTPTEISIGESLLFTVDVINPISDTDATGVETFFLDLANDTRIPLASLTEQSETPSDRQVFQGKFVVPSGVPANQYDQFFAEATFANNEKLSAPFNQEVELSTDCATVNVSVFDSSTEAPLPLAEIAVEGKTAITNAEGHAALTQLTDNTKVELLVKANGFEQQQKDPVEDKTIIELNCLNAANETVFMNPTTKDCAQLNVTVIDDSESALPVAGALITVASNTGTTDDEGKAAFERLIEGPQTINISANDFFPLAQNVELSCDTLTNEIMTLKSKECATAQVKIVNDSGTGIPDVAVSIASTTGFTNNEGIATLENILEGTHSINVSASGFGNPIGDIPPAVLTCDSENFLPNIILDICAKVDVIVSDNHESRLSSAEVNISNFSAITGENGVATFTQLDSGNHAYQVSKPGLESVTGTFLIQECRTSPDAVFPPLNVILDTDCATAQVKVVNDSGKGIPNAEVSIASVTGFTNSEGIATLENIQEGTHSVNVIASGFGNPISDIPPAVLSCNNESFLPNIILDICAEINFFVFFDGQVPGATVNISGFSAITDSFGNARFTQLNPGSHSYQVSKPDFLTTTGLHSFNECRTSTNDVTQIDVQLEFDPSSIPQ